MRQAHVSILTPVPILLVVALAGAQPAESPSRPGFGWGAGRAFDPASLETIQGEIIEVTNVPSASGRRARGVHLSVSTGEGPVSVHVAPEWYLRRLSVAFAVGDPVTVTGSRVSWPGGPGLVATEVRRGESVLRLRSSDGAPAWGAWGGGGRGCGRGRGLGPGWGRAGGQPSTP
jgi:hypothetical protein